MHCYWTQWYVIQSNGLLSSKCRSMRQENNTEVDRKNLKKYTHDPVFLEIQDILEMLN